jgi:hypothetical protein
MFLQLISYRYTNMYFTYVTSFVKGQISSRNLYANNFLFVILCGDRFSTVVKVLCYKSEGRWFDPG